MNEDRETRKLPQNSIGESIERFERKRGDWRKGVEKEGSWFARKNRV